MLIIIYCKAEGRFSMVVREGSFHQMHWDQEKALEFISGGHILWPHAQHTRLFGTGIFLEGKVDT